MLDAIELQMRLLRAPSREDREHPHLLPIFGGLQVIFCGVSFVRMCVSYLHVSFGARVPR